MTGPKKTALIDMWNFQHDASLHNLLGAPQGFVNSEKPGLLSRLFEQGAPGVRFDDMELAAPAVQKALCETDDNGSLRRDTAGKLILRGEITTAQGEVISLRTSSLGL